MRTPTAQAEEPESTRRRGTLRSPARWGDRVWALAVFALLSGIYSLTLSTGPSIDVEAANYSSWNLATQHTRWVPDDYLGHLEVRDVWLGANGEHTVVTRAPGVVAASLPAYWIFGGEQFSLLPASVTAALLTAAGMALLFLALRTRMALGPAVLAVLVVGLATPLWSVAADGLWPHTLTTFALGGMAWSCATGRWWLLGLFGGVGLWGRSHFALVVALVALAMAWRLRSPWVAVRAGSVALLALLGTIAWSRWMFGAWRLTGSYQVGSVDDLTSRYPSLWINELGLWVAPDRGILAWSPLALVLLPALLLGRRAVPYWAWALLGGGFAYVLVQGFAQVFHGGDGYWGYRLGLEVVVSAAPALAMALAEVGRSALVLFWPLLGVQLLMIATGAVLDASGFRAEHAWVKNSFWGPIWQFPPAAVGVALVAGALGWALGGLSRPVHEALRTGSS